MRYPTVNERNRAERRMNCAYLRGRGLTFTEIGKEQRVTRERARQIVNAGFRIMRHFAIKNDTLASAAPVLLLACKEAVRQLKQTGADREDYEEITDAIKKAEGKL